MGIFLSDDEARRAVRALISAGHGGTQAPDPYAKALADRLLTRRIAALNEDSETSPEGSSPPDLYCGYCGEPRHEERPAFPGGELQVISCPMVPEGYIVPISLVDHPSKVPGYWERRLHVDKLPPMP